MSRSTLVGLCLLLATAPGCSKKPKMDLPTYPGAAGMAGGSTNETEEAIIWHQVVHTPDSIAMVRTYYIEELETKRGWKLSPGSASAWTNGNMTLGKGGGSFGNATADDITAEGGFVQLIEGDRETICDHWQSKPKPKKK